MASLLACSSSSGLLARRPVRQQPTVRRSAVRVAAVAAPLSPDMVEAAQPKQQQRFEVRAPCTALALIIAHKSSWDCGWGGAGWGKRTWRAAAPWPC